MIIKKIPIPEIIFLLIITAIVYLPNIGSLTYFKDDWYYIYDGIIAGGKIFHTMFSIDRPARGYFFELYYSLFGAQSFSWHISAYLWRALSGIGALWLFNLLWDKERKFAFFTALLFAIYPGYYWWISAIEYQPMIASLALQVFSIVFTLKAIQSSNRIPKIGYLLGAILTGWIYIALVDYAIGMEAFRFLCVYILINRKKQTDSPWKQIRDSFHALGWNLLIPIGFLLWRTFFFQNQREATDISLQLNAFFNNPAEMGAHWFTQTFNSLLNLGILAWVNQFPRFFFDMRLRDIGFGLIFAGLAILFAALAENILREGLSEQKTEANAWEIEAFWLGSLGMAVGILPVVMANRYINLEGFSHYALPASLASAFFITSFIGLLSSRRIQTGILFSVIAFSAMAHYGISVSAANEELAIQKFWWQVSWRVPALQPDITLVINYPSSNIGDDGNGVLEAANMIYFPQPRNQVPVHYNISAVTLNGENLQEVMLGKLYQETQYRSHTMNMNYQNVLVISQPTPSSCVHVIDGTQPVISALDPPTVALAAPVSNIENVIVGAKPSVPQEFAFGAEPEHKWCYYYEKAELALQQADWKKIATLGEEAISMELHPQDQSEWMPFLKAYAITGNDTRVKQTASKIGTETMLRLQACEMLMKIKEPLSDKVKDLIATHYCKTAPK